MKAIVSDVPSRIRTRATDFEIPNKTKSRSKLLDFLAVNLNWPGRWFLIKTFEDDLEADVEEIRRQIQGMPEGVYDGYFLFWVVYMNLHLDVGISCFRVMATIHVMRFSKEY